MGLTWQAPVTAPVGAVTGGAGCDCADTSAPMATAVAQARPANRREETLNGRIAEAILRPTEAWRLVNSEQE